MNGVVLLYRDFSPEWIDVLKDTGLKKLGLHVNAQQNSVGEFLGWLDLNRPLVERAEECGLTVEYYLHALGYLMPADFAKRREYWRSDGSERVRGCNCCPSSPALFYAEKNAERLAAGLKQRSHGYHFWTDDDFGRDVSCKCERCRPLGPTAQNMLLYGAMARGVRKYDEKAVLSYLVYGNEDIDGKAGDTDGFFVEYAPFLRRHDLPLSAKENDFYRKRAVSLAARFRPVSVLEYFLSFDYPSFCRGAQYARVKEDVAFYRSLGAKDVMTFAVFPEKDYVKKHGCGGIERYAALWRD